MPNFKGMKLTRHGMELLGLVGTGTVLDFTSVAVGSGIWTAGQQEAPAELTGLVREEMSLDIGSVVPTSVPETDEPAGCYTVHSMLTNAGLASGFSLREIGIFATHPTRGEVLYAVDYAGEQYDYIPSLPAGAAPLEKQFRIDVVTGNAQEITIKQAPVLLATHDDMDGHNTDPEAHPDLLARMATGIPEILNPADGAADVGETPIYRFREFTPVFAGSSEEAIQVQVDLDSGTFATAVHDSGFLTTITNGYEQPAGMLQPGKRYKARCRRRLSNGLISPWSEVVFFETRAVFNYVARPANVSPSNGATGVMECPVLISSAFAVVGGEADTHEATQYRMRVGDVVLHLSPELGAVIEYVFPAGLLLVSGDYVWEVRYKGAALGWSEWSTATSFHTAAAFVTGDEALKFSAWDGHDNASSAGVALADNAALRSNGVDQGELEGDWVSFSARAKVRGGRLPLDARTSATHIITNSKVIEGQAIQTDLGKVLAGTVTKNDVDPLNGEYTFEGSNLAAVTDGNDGTYAEMSTGAGLSNNLTFKFIFPEALSFTRFAAKVDNPSSMSLSIWSNGQQVSTDYTVNGNIIEQLFPEGIELQEVLLSVGMYQSYSSRRVLEIYLGSAQYQVDISAAGLGSAPAIAAIIPKLTAATGAAGTAFTAQDFTEIAVKTATLGTDADTDRPDFILLESEKITPAVFRRVAIGASNLSKDSETRISETQCDTWKQGA